MAGLLHDVGHGPFAHFFDEQVLAAFPAPADPRRPDGKRLTHEDLSGRIIEDELGPLLRGLRRAPGDVAERDAFADDEAIDPAWVSFLISKPALADAAMPRWVRWLQPLLSGVFTVDNLDYVRRDAYITGVAVGPVDVERLRRYTFISERGLTLYEPGLGALEMFLTARRFMYQQVYFHRTVRAIDLDLAEVFEPSVRAIFGEGSPADRLGAYADLDEYALLHQAARWARGESVSPDPSPGDGTVTGPSRTAGGRSCCASRPGAPTWRSGPSTRRAPAGGADRDARSPRAGGRRDRPRRRGRAAGRRLLRGCPAVPREPRRPGPVGLRSPRVHPGVVAHRPALPAGGAAALRPTRASGPASPGQPTVSGEGVGVGFALGSGFGVGWAPSSGAAARSSGSIRAIS